MDNLTKLDIKYLHGVGPKRAELLASELGIRSYYDLLHYYPFRYVDKSKIHKICEINGEMPYIQLKGVFVAFATHGEGAKRRLNALFTDGTGTIDVVWFNKVKHIEESYHTGVEYVIFGKPSLFNSRYSITHPEIDLYKPGLESQGLKGIYNITEKMRNRAFTSRTMQQLQENLQQVVKGVEETLPAELITKRRLM